MPDKVIGSGNSEYIFQQRNNPANRLIVKMNDNQKLNDAGKIREAEDYVYKIYPDMRGQFELQSSKIATPFDDARAQQKIGEVS